MKYGVVCSRTKDVPLVANRWGLQEIYCPRLVARRRSRRTNINTTTDCAQLSRGGARRRCEERLCLERRRGGGATPQLCTKQESVHTILTSLCIVFNILALVVLHIHRCQICDTPWQERRLWRQTGGRWRWRTRDCSSLGSRREVQRCRADKRVRRCTDRKLRRGKFAEKKGAWLACIQK